MDKSLDEIIKSRFNGKKSPKQGNKKGAIKKPNFKKSFPQKPIVKPMAVLADARSKIIVAKRAKISDARVLLAKKERSKRNNKPVRQQQKPQHQDLRQIANRKLQKLRPSRPTIRIEVSDEDDDDMMEGFHHLQQPAPVLRRTVKNDRLPPPMPALPKFGRDIAMKDPFDCYEPYERPAFIPTAPPAPKISSMDDMYYNNEKNIKGILRATKESPIKSRLYSVPDPRQPSGIFGRDREPEFPAPASGYRIIVSNLHKTVTQSDIQELFEDIGELVEARMVRNGVAEVIYRDLKDAEIAVETYHNRQLDGIAMQCLLVRPRSNPNPVAAPTGRSFNKNIEIDMDTLHKVLFKR